MRTALILSALLCSAAPSLNAAETSAIDRAKNVEIVSKSDCCPAEVRFRVKGSDGARDYVATGDFQKVTEVRPVAAGRFLVIGELNHGGDVLAVVDGDDGEQELSLWAYGFSVSPGGRRLVYSTHYPRLGPPQARRSIVLLYDLTTTPAENRRGAPRQDWPEHNDGIPVFPPENACEPSYSLFLAEPPFLVTSPFLWSSDGERLVFFTAREDRSEPALVRLDLSRGACDGFASVALDLSTRLRCPAQEDRSLLLAPERLAWADEEESTVEAFLNGPCPFGDRLSFAVP